MVAFVIPIMDSSYHFLVSNPQTHEMVSNTKVLPAPQANMIAAVSKGLLEDRANQPWLLYGLGGFVAIMLYMAGVPMLAFALGIYIPIPINMAVLAGAFVSHIVGNTGGSAKVKKARREQGVLIASGLMAGGAILGIVAAILRLTGLGAPIRFLAIGEKFSLDTSGGETLLTSKPEKWFEGLTGQGISLAMFVLLAVLCFLLAQERRGVVSPRGGSRERVALSHAFRGGGV